MMTITTEHALIVFIGHDENKICITHTAPPDNIFGISRISTVIVGIPDIKVGFLFLSDVFNGG